VRRTPRAKDFEKENFIFARVNCLVAVASDRNLGCVLGKVIKISNNGRTCKLEGLVIFLTPVLCFMCFCVLHCAT
jgi:hypothetical protein